MYLYRCHVSSTASPAIADTCRIVIANIAGIVFLPETRPPHMIQPSDDETGQLKRPDTTYAATLKVPNFALITGVFLSKHPSATMADVPTDLQASNLVSLT